MKKWTALLLIAVMVVSLIGCGQESATEQTTAVTAAATETATDTTTTEPADEAEVVAPVDIEGKFAVGFARADISPTEAVPISGITANGTDRITLIQLRSLCYARMILPISTLKPRP